MKTKLKKFIDNYLFLIIFFFLYLTVLVGLYFNEDNLGGAINDATYHFKISQKFNENFYYTLFNFGNHAEGLGTRNSPVFWIFLSILDKYFSYETIQFLNTFIIFAIAIIFYKSLLLKFKDINPTNLIFLSSFMFLSPGLRSLGIWPYSLIWGLFFFVVSIYYYFKFIDNLNFSRSALILGSVILASYIYPSFSVFYLFYFFEISKKLKNKIYIISLLFFSFIFSIPCLFYLLTNDFFTSFQNAQGVQLPISQSFNISNKILVISTMSIYFILPFINLKEIILKIRKLKNKEIIFLIIFCLINFYFFNFPHFKWGGGFFHKFSNIFFGNNYIFFLSAFISVSFIYIIVKKDFKNYLLLIILILYNPQLTIYAKYFDPLIFILFLTLFDFNLKKHFIKKPYAYYQFYGVILFYYIAIYYKKILI
jgi:hypothetical protein